MLKKLGIIVVVFIIGIVLIYYPQIKGHVFFKEDVYIVFDLKKDSTVLIEWGKYKYLFPESFDVDKVKIVDNRYQGSFRDSISKGKMDSVIKRYKQSTRKFIDNIGNTKRYGVQIFQYGDYIFDYNELKPITSNDIKKLNVISLDSTIKILKKDWPSTGDWEDSKIQFYIIETGNSNDSAFVAKSTPVSIIHLAGYR